MVCMVNTTSAGLNCRRRYLQNRLHYGSAWKQKKCLCRKLLEHRGDACIWYFWNKYLASKEWTPFCFFSFGTKPKCFRRPKIAGFPQADEAMLGYWSRYNATNAGGDC